MQYRLPSLKNRALLIVFMLLLTAGINLVMGQQAGGPEKIAAFNKLRYKTYQGANGWGYDILQGDTLLVHQPLIPGVPGMQGFTSSVRAEKVAAFVIGKIKHGIFPPTVTRQELDSLGVMKK